MGILKTILLTADPTEVELGEILRFLGNWLQPILIAFLIYLTQSQYRDLKETKKQKRDDLIKQQNNEQLKNTIRKISMRHVLYSYYQEFKDLDTLTSSQYNDWHEAFIVYTTLHGNGTVKHMNDTIEEKEIK